MGKIINGNTPTTGNSDFKLMIEIADIVCNASNYTIKFYYQVEVTRGNFQGSTLTCSWGNVNVTLNGTGTAYRSPTAQSVTVNYGSVHTFSAYAQYRGGSGTLYKSSISYTYYPTMKVYDGSGWKDAIPWVYNGSTWKHAIPLVYNGSGWKGTIS